MTDTALAPLPAGFSNDLGWLIAQCFGAYVSALEDAVTDIPHGRRGFQALSGAVNCSAHNQAELAKQLGVDRTVMVYLVDDLAKAGLVERITDPNDRRSKLIRATPAGRKRLEKAQASIDAAEAQVLAPLSADDREKFRSMMRSIAAHHLTSSPGNTADPCDLAESVTKDNG